MSLVVNRPRLWLWWWSPTVYTHMSKAWLRMIRCPLYPSEPHTHTHTSTHKVWQMAFLERKTVILYHLVLCSINGVVWRNETGSLIALKGQFADRIARIVTPRVMPKQLVSDSNHILAFKQLLFILLRLLICYSFIFLSLSLSVNVRNSVRFTLMWTNWLVDVTENSRLRGWRSDQRWRKVIYIVKYQKLYF